jgi:hypothetical protein
MVIIALSSVMFWIWNVSHRPMCWTCAPQLVALFGEVVETLGGALLEEECSRSMSWRFIWPQSLPHSPPWGKQPLPSHIPVAMVFCPSVWGQVPGTKPSEAMIKINPPLNLVSYLATVIPDLLRNQVFILANKVSINHCFQHL